MTALDGQWWWMKGEALDLFITATRGVGGWMRQEEGVGAALSCKGW